MVKKPAKGRICSKKARCAMFICGGSRKKWDFNGGGADESTGGGRGEQRREPFDQKHVRKKGRRKRWPDSLWMGQVFRILRKNTKNSPEIFKKMRCCLKYVQLLFVNIFLACEHHLQSTRTKNHSFTKKPERTRKSWRILIGWVKCSAFFWGLTYILQLFFTEPSTYLLQNLFKAPKQKY